jgi:hypothetical protein
MEKDNTKARTDARKKYCTEIKSLVDFVKRRDRRVQQKLVRQQQLRAEKELDKQKEIAARVSHSYHHWRVTLARHL